MSKRHMSVSQRGVQASSGPVQLRVVERAADHSVMEIGIDYSRVDVPERAYYADYCDVQQGRVDFSLLFGKLIPGSNALRTEIEIAFPQELLVAQLWGGSRDLQKTVMQIAEKKPLQPLEDIKPTDKVQTFRANNVFMGVWGEDAVLDFYFISPRDMHYFMTQNLSNISLEPVIRVVVGTALLAEFLEKCGTHVDRITTGASTNETQLGVPR